jgi:hypothetical protein
MISAQVVTNSDDFLLKEVDETLAAEQGASWFRQYAPVLIGGSALIIAGVGGYQLWRASAEKASADASSAFQAAAKAAEESPDAGREALRKIIDERPAGYALLARMRLAALLAAEKDLPGALVHYRAVYASSTASKRLKDLARIKAASIAFAEGRDAVSKDLGPLVDDPSALGHYARELTALAALGAGDYQTAEEMFRKSAADAKAPEGVRLRAPEFAALAGAAKSGVKIDALKDARKSDVDLHVDQLESAGSRLKDVLNPAPPPAPPSE